MTREQILAGSLALPPPEPKSDPPGAHLSPLPAEPLISLAPNADGLVDLTGIGRTEATDAIPNPFRLRYHPAGATREFHLAIDSVLIGDRPQDAAAIINCRICAPGDTLGGLKITRIAADGLDFLANGIRVRLPIRERDLTLRLSQ